MEYSYNWSDFIGNIGVLLLVGTFALLQFDKIDAKGFWYSFNNFIVAILLLVNLFYKPNISAIAIEFFWILLSLIGLYRWYKKETDIRL